MNIITKKKCTLNRFLWCGSLGTKSCLTVAHQAPLSMGFFRQVYWNGFLFPSPGDLPDPGIKPRSPALQADSLLTDLLRKPQQTIMSSQCMLEGETCDFHAVQKKDVYLRLAI